RSSLPDANATLNKVNIRPPNPFRADGPPPIRAARGPLLRRKGLDVRRVRRRPAGLGAHASPLRDPRGPRFDALPRAEPLHDRAPGAGDTPAALDGGGQGRCGRRARRLAPNLPSHRCRCRRGRGRGDSLGLPARTSESDRGRGGPADLRAVVAARSPPTPPRLPRLRIRDRVLERRRRGSRRLVAGSTLGRADHRRSAAAGTQSRHPSLRRGRGVRDAGPRRAAVPSTARSAPGGDGMERDCRNLARPRGAPVPEGRDPYRRRARGTVRRSRMNWNRSSLSAIFAPAPFASFRHASLKRALPAIAKDRARASYAYASGKSPIPPSSQISRERWAWYSAGSGRRSNAYTWEICHSPIAASLGPPTTLQWYREAYAIWIIRSSSSFVRFFFAIKSHVEWNSSAAIFRCHCLS